MATCCELLDLELEGGELLAPVGAAPGGPKSPDCHDGHDCHGPKDRPAIMHYKISETKTANYPPLSLEQCRLGT